MFSKLSQLFQGWKGLIIFLTIILLPEIVALRFINSDLGSFIFVTFHFVIAPILSLIYLVPALGWIIKSNIPADWLAPIIGIIGAAGFLYLAATGNTHWVTFLRGS